MYAQRFYVIIMIAIFILVNVYHLRKKKFIYIHSSFFLKNPDSNIEVLFK